MSSAQISLAPAAQDVVLFRGGTGAYLYDLDYSTDNGRTWLTLDLTGYTQIEVVGFDADFNELFSWSELGGELVVDRSNGLIQVGVDQAVLEAFNFDSCGYYFRVTDGAGIQSGITGGLIRLTWTPDREFGQC